MQHLHIYIYVLTTMKSPSSGKTRHDLIISFEKFFSLSGIFKSIYGSLSRIKSLMFSSSHGLQLILFAWIGFMKVNFACSISFNSGQYYTQSTRGDCFLVLVFFHCSRPEYKQFCIINICLRAREGPCLKKKSMRQCLLWTNLPGTNLLINVHMVSSRPPRLHFPSQA